MRFEEIPGLRLGLRIREVHHSKYACQGIDRVTGPVNDEIRRDGAVTRGLVRQPSWLFLTFHLPVIFVPRGCVLLPPRANRGASLPKERWTDKA
jgi:hypothetical protein